MLRLLLDQDLDQDIWRGLLRRTKDVDAVTAYEAGLSDLRDEDLLKWAEENNRILITQDRRTMPRHAANHLSANRTLPGVIIVPRSLSLAVAIEQLEIIVTCSEHHEWQNVIKILPL